MDINIIHLNVYLIFTAINERLRALMKDDETF